MEDIGNVSKERVDLAKALLRAVEKPAKAKAKAAAGEKKADTKDVSSGEATA